MNLAKNDIDAIQEWIKASPELRKKWCPLADCKVCELHFPRIKERKSNNTVDHICPCHVYNPQYVHQKVIQLLKEYSSGQKIWNPGLQEIE